MDYAMCHFNKKTKLIQLKTQLIQLKNLNYYNMTNYNKTKKKK